MRIDLESVRREPFHWRETQEVSPESVDHPELEALGEIEWRGKISHTDPGFYLEGVLDYEQTLQCTRCLSSFTEPVHADVGLLLLVDEEQGRGEPEGGEEAGEEVELSEEELGVVTLSEPFFDTDPILREQLQLNIPMKPVCRTDCQGLCPVCGVDRNQDGCSCEETTVDPRWAALAGLKDSLPDAH